MELITIFIGYAFFMLVLGANVNQIKANKNEIASLNEKVIRLEKEIAHLKRK